MVPTSGEPAAEPSPAPSGESTGTTSLLKNDTDQVHSPDDPPPDTSAESGFSSSLAGANDINIPDEEKASMVSLKDWGAGFIADVRNKVPAGREQSLAITKIEEAVMWAVKGLTN